MDEGGDKFLRKLPLVSRLSLRHPGVDLSFQICERGKAGALLAAVWLAAYESVHRVAVERVKLARAVGCQFKTCDEFHCFLQ